MRTNLTSSDGTDDGYKEVETHMQLVKVTKLVKAAVILPVPTLVKKYPNFRI